MEIPGAIHEQDHLQGIHTAPGPHKDHPEAYKTGFSPHLQVMCGPMLKYDTVENNTWLGYAMLVCSDPGSDYSSKPFLTWSSKPHGLNSPASVKSPYPPSQSPQNLNMAGLSMQDDQGQAVHVDGFQLYRYYALHGGKPCKEYAGNSLKIDVRQHLLAIQARGSHARIRTSHHLFDQRRSELHLLRRGAWAELSLDRPFLQWLFCGSQD
jgi:hypothetical protein